MTHGASTEGRSIFMNGEYHIKLKMTGNKSKISLFNTILADADRDYPYRPDREKGPLTCGKCGGAIYRAPRYKPMHLLGLATQINATDLLPGRFKLKIKRFCKEGTCAQKAAQGLARAQKEALICV